MTKRRAESSVADTLSHVWRDQARSGFLLSDPATAEIEIREFEDPISQVTFRFKWLPQRELRYDVPELEARGILDPDRDESVLFRDPRDPTGAFCFLCPANIRESNPREELVQIDLAGRSYYAGANFAWISREHFTVMAAEHVDQVFSAHTIAAMLDLHSQTNGRFRVVYNGPQAGATIPWHLHVQITSERFPVEALPAGQDHAYPTTVRRFAAGDEAAALAYRNGWIRRDPEHHRVNALVAGSATTPAIYLFPRDTRLSHAAAKGLIGGFEVCGDFIYSEPDRRADFDSASAELARSLLAEVRPTGM